MTDSITIITSGSIYEPTKGAEESAKSGEERIVPLVSEARSPKNTSYTGLATMKETSKANRRRLMESSFWGRVFQGRGIDVGAGDDPFDASLWSDVVEVESFDRQHGDANVILRHRREWTYDFVHSSNCLEHMKAPKLAFQQWFSLLKEGGYLVITVPDEDLYEQGHWPSKWNGDHKWTFTILKQSSWSPKSVNVFGLLNGLRDCRVVRVAVVDTGYDYEDKSGRDQTLMEDGAEAFIEIVVQKKHGVVISSNPVFKHSGARGDMIYGLPVIKAHGGGILAVHLDGTHYVGKPIGRGNDFAQWRELLESQSYIRKVVEWDGMEPSIDLDLFRDMSINDMALSEAHLKRFDVGFDLGEPWLEFDPLPVADIVIARSGRYIGHLEWENLRPWSRRCVFVGFEEERQRFMEKVGFELPLFEGSLLEAARAIAGCKLFVGNQSFPYALAEAMKVPRVLEVCDGCPNCMPQSSNGHTALTRAVVRHYVDGIGAEPIGKSLAHSDCQFGSPMSLSSGKDSLTGPIIGVLTNGHKFPLNCGFPLMSDDEMVYFVVVLYGDVDSIAVGWHKGVFAAFRNPKVGAVRPYGSDERLLIVRRSLFELLDDKSSGSVVEQILRDGHAIVNCSTLRLSP